jgi:hypothetical protein
MESASRAAAARWVGPSGSPSQTKASAAPKKGALAKQACARVAPSCCADAMYKAMLAP